MGEIGHKIRLSSVLEAKLTGTNLNRNWKQAMPFILDVSGGVSILLMRHLGNVFLSSE